MHDKPGPGSFEGAEDIVSKLENYFGIRRKPDPRPTDDDMRREARRLVIGSDGADALTNEQIRILTDVVVACGFIRYEMQNPGDRKIPDRCAVNALADHVNHEIQHGNYDFAFMLYALLKIRLDDSPRFGDVVRRAMSEVADSHPIGIGINDAVLRFRAQCRDRA